MSHSIDISSIHIAPERQRQDFDPEALTDLANSISAHGLLHPIVVRETAVGLVLVAGERRLRAMETLHAIGDVIRHNGAQMDANHVPYITLGELDPIASEEAELDENLKRENLSWQEEASAISRLHVLRQKQADLAGTTHSITDTAREVRPDSDSMSTSRAIVTSNLILAANLSNPAVQSAKSPKDAMKILRKQEETRSNQALAERVGKTFNSSIHELHHADCIEWLKTCPKNTFDVILTDPPYGMDAQKFGDGAGRLENSEHHYDDSLTTWANLMNTFCEQIYLAAKPQAHAYIFCDIDNFHRLKLYMQDGGWYVFRTPLINYKPRSGRVPLPEHGPRRQYEICLYAIKGNKPVTAIYSDVISTVLEENLTHGAQKPVELYIDLLRRSVRPGDIVLDAFAGTGTIFPAAHAMKCKAVGIEQSSEYYGISVSRLNSLDNEPALL